MSDDTPLDTAPDDEPGHANAQTGNEDAAPGDAAGVPVPSEDAAGASSETFRPVSE
jgi:hypothetical protein